MTDHPICVLIHFISCVVGNKQSDHGQFGASIREVRYSSHLGPHFPGACFSGCVSPDEGDNALGQLTLWDLVFSSVKWG